MKKSLLILTVLATLLTSCNKLTRTNAEDLIRRKYSLPYPTTGTIPKWYKYKMNFAFISSAGTQFMVRPVGDDLERMLKNMQANGLVRMDQVNFDDWTLVNITLTPEGQKYVISSNDAGYEVRLFDNDFDGITGMVEYEQPLKYSLVSYTTKNINETPFSQFFKVINKEQHSFSAKIVKYDDGWRIN